MMFLKIKGKPGRLYLEPGHLYLLGNQRNGFKQKSRNFIHLERDDTDERHCVIEISSSKEVYVFDLFSLKGTFLNNKQLNSLEKSRLMNGDILKMGKNKIQFIDDRYDVSHGGCCLGIQNASRPDSKWQIEKENSLNDLRETCWKASPASVNENPDKNFNTLKKNNTAGAETDLDLLLRTPEVIKNNISVDRPEDLKKKILYAKRKSLFDCESDNENTDQDEYSVLRNKPKYGSDFDMLLPHLNRTPQDNNMSEKEKEDIEVQKIYKFNMFIGKQDENQSEIPTTKPSPLSTDKSQAAREKYKIMPERREKTKNIKGFSKDTNQNKSEHVEPITAFAKSEKNTTGKRDKNNFFPKTYISSISEAKKAEMPTRRMTRSNSIFTEMSKMPARRMTRSNSIFIDCNPDNINYKDNHLKNIAEQPKIRVARSHLNSIRNDLKESLISKSLIFAEMSKMPARRMTRSNSIFIECNPENINYKDDYFKNIAPQPKVRVARTQLNSIRNDFKESLISKIPQIKE